MSAPLTLHRPPVPTVLRPFVDPQGRLIQMPKREQKRVEALRWVAVSRPLRPAKLAAAAVARHNLRPPAVVSRSIIKCRRGR